MLFKVVCIVYDSEKLRTGNQLNHETFLRGLDYFTRCEIQFNVLVGHPLVCWCSMRVIAIDDWKQLASSFHNWSLLQCLSRPQLDWRILEAGKAKKERKKSSFVFIQWTLFRSCNCSWARKPGMNSFNAMAREANVIQEFFDFGKLLWLNMTFLFAFRLDEFIELNLTKIDLPSIRKMFFLRPKSLFRRRRR